MGKIILLNLMIRQKETNSRWPIFQSLHNKNNNKRNLWSFPDMSRFRNIDLSDKLACCF